MDKYQWTKHVLYKMKQYGLSQQRVKRVIRMPERIEEGIVPKTIACMQSSGNSKHKYEIWCMYQIKRKAENEKRKTNLEKILNGQGIKIISAWKYPGTSPKNNPIPEEIMEELRNFI
jgi:hypothetical protein